MKKTTKLVLDYLKPKVKALGFTKEEIEGIAADLADNLSLEEEASDEEVEEAVKKVVEPALPYLKVAQKVSQRTIQRFKEESDHSNDDDDDSVTTGNQKQKEEEMPAWAKALIDSNNLLKEELASMKAERTTLSRKEQIAELVKGTGLYGENILKNFHRMTFTDEEFEDYKSDLEQDVVKLKQEMADQGLRSLEQPGAVSKKQQKEEEKPYDEKELESLAESMI